ncbi:hypothetical protein EX399_10415 [Salmonella enterica]|uniref:hypothetical protein n=1 Tax=Citrobacter braakii TaxID=57706 RepID=UPI00066B13D0|nr:hypothetical protein [Citrobacter braakii]EAT1308187.1 hypothetical protein [Salmonella enterica]EBI7171792.1 hypothetical protein [Salmonella enterica]EJK1420425.1 hypothetical protein [Salmonella enterica]
MEKNDQINQDEVKSVARAALDYIDALPKEVVAALPAMPGFDRDWAENVLADVTSPTALIPNHMFFDNDDEPYTVLRTIKGLLEMQGFIVKEDPERMFAPGAHGNQEAQAAATCTAYFADVPRDVLEKVIPTDNRFNIDMSDVLKGIGIDLKDEKLWQLSDSMTNTVNELANYLISDGWTPHEITFDGRYRFSKQVGGEMQYRDIISRVEGNGPTLRANVWDEAVQVEGK